MLSLRHVSCSKKVQKICLRTHTLAMAFLKVIRWSERRTNSFPPQPLWDTVLFCYTRLQKPINPRGLKNCSIITAVTLGSPRTSPNGNLEFHTSTNVTSGGRHLRSSSEEHLSDLFFPPFCTLLSCKSVLRCLLRRKNYAKSWWSVTIRNDHSHPQYLFLV